MAEGSVDGNGFRRGDKAGSGGVMDTADIPPIVGDTSLAEDTGSALTSSVSPPARSEMEKLWSARGGGCSVTAWSPRVGSGLSEGTGGAAGSSSSSQRRRIRTIAPFAWGHASTALSAQ